MLPPGAREPFDTQLCQFVGTLGWLGQIRRLVSLGPAGVHLHLGLDNGYANSALPTTQEYLLFMLSYLKENPTQTYHRFLYRMTQPKVNPWV